MYRSISEFKLNNCYYLILVLCFIMFQYLVYVYYYLANMGRITQICAGIFFHLIFFMLLWSLVRTVISDPGQVPRYWGNFMDDPESNKRRYCIICHLFKPERCHHCSNCQRCVLNMDHHCPWINNCVGFRNRKFFLLMLLYINLTSLFMICTESGAILKQLNTLFIKQDYYTSINLTMCIMLLAYIMQLLFQTVIIFFFKFHIELIKINSSTIENLEKEKAGKNVLESIYNIGWEGNFLQIFGQNAWLWLLPIFGKTGQPNGDGVIWPKQVITANIIQDITDSSDQKLATANVSAGTKI